MHDSLLPCVRGKRAGDEGVSLLWCGLFQHPLRSRPAGLQGFLYNWRWEFSPTLEMDLFTLERTSDDTDEKYCLGGIRPTRPPHLLPLAGEIRRAVQYPPAAGD